MTVDRNLNLSLALRQILIFNRHDNRTINILTRSDLNFTSLRIDHSRNILAVLILSGDLGVLIRVADLDASALLLIGRINRLRSAINRGLLANRQRNAVGDLVLLVVVIHQGVRHGDVWRVLISLDFLSRSTGDLSVFLIEVQTCRKVSNLKRAVLHLELVRVTLKAGRHNLLLILGIDRCSLQRRIRDGQQGRHAIVLDFLNINRFGLDDALVLRSRRVHELRIAVFVENRTFFLHRDLDVTRHDHLRGARRRRRTRDLAGLWVERQPFRKTIDLVGRLSAFNLVLRLIRQYGQCIKLFVLVLHRTERKNNRNDNGERVSGQHRVLASDELSGEDVARLSVLRNGDGAGVGISNATDVVAGLDDLAVLLPNNLVWRHRERAGHIQLRGIADISRLVRHVEVRDIQLHIMARHQREVHVVPHRILHKVFSSNRRRVTRAVVLRRVKQRNTPCRVSARNLAISSLYMRVQVLLRVIRESSLRELHRVVPIFTNLRAHRRCNVLRVLSEELLRSGQLLRLRQRVNCLCICADALLGQHTHDHVHVLSRDIAGAVWAVETSVLRLVPDLAAHMTLHRRICGLPRDSLIRIRNPISLRLMHVRHITISLHQHSSALHVRADGVPCTLLVSTHGVAVCAWEEAADLAERVDGEAVALVNKRVDPQTVVLIRGSLVRVLLPVVVNPRLTEIEHIGARTSLRGVALAELVRGAGNVHRRNGTILIDPLHVDLRAFRNSLLATVGRAEAVAIVNKRATRQGRLGIRHASSALDVAVRNAVGDNRTVFLSGRRLGDSSSFLLRKRDRLSERSNQRK